MKLQNWKKKDFSSLIFNSYFKSNGKEINKENYSDFIGYLKTNGYKLVK